LYTANGFCFENLLNRFWIKCLLNQQKSWGLLLLDIPRKTGAINSFHVSTYQCLHSNVFTIASVPDRVFIKNAGEEATWESSKLYTSIGAQVIYFVSPYSYISLHCPNTADKWRVVLKAERLDYINASFVNVGIKHMYIQMIPRCSIMILWYLYAGLQAVQRVHRYTGPYEEHLSGFLEDGVWEGVWVDSDAVRPGREWRGDFKMMGLNTWMAKLAYHDHIFKTFSFSEMPTFCTLIPMLMSLLQSIKFNL